MEASIYPAEIHSANNSNQWKKPPPSPTSRGAIPAPRDVGPPRLRAAEDLTSVLPAAHRHVRRGA